MKSADLPKKEETKDSRLSLNFPKKEKEKNLSNFQSFLKDNRARSAKPLLRKFVPRLKPVKANMNPSIFYLNGIYEFFNYNKNKSISDINIVAEEDYEKKANSGDESYSYNNSHSEKDNFLSYNDDNTDFIDNNENNIDKNSINIIITKKKKCVKNNINRIRKHLLKTKEKIRLKEFNDDTSIISNNPYKNYLTENFVYEKYYLNDNNEIISDNSIDLDIDFFNKITSKSIYAGKYKNKNRPPILGFLQMNDNSANTTLSSGFSEI